ncbi:MAG: cytochrome C biogenesis protein, partial [bacterium]|nr:cytochrome C biogenesis protein [bacterium]
MNPIISFLSSLKLSAALMGAVACSSAIGTFIETDVGRDGAYARVYAAHWFEALLGLLTLNLFFLFVKRWPYKPRQWGFMLLHVSIMVIMISSAITRYIGFEGIMNIR